MPAHPVALEQLHAGDFAPDQVGFRRDHGLCKELHPGFIAEQVRHAVAIRQQARRDEAQVDDPPKREDRRQGRHFENRERLQPLRPRDPIDQQVRRGPDQRQTPAQDRGIAQRDQKAGSRAVQRLGDLHENGDHHDDDGRVVHHRRGPRRR